MFSTSLFTIALLAVAIFTGVTALLLRRVVAPNEVHIVQRRKTTKSYGKDTPNGNTYYEWPSWVPVIGMTKVVLPVSVFNLPLDEYEAYDVGRVPFMVDVMAFFRIDDTNLAAQRVESYGELQEQLLAIVQGAVRTVLASYDIDNIMLERSTFGEAFTKEVEKELLSWGVVPVKNMELMDIRDKEGEQVIENIMEKKKSLIEKESRIEVANNIRDAQNVEIDAQRDVDLQAEQARKDVGLRKAQVNKEVGIADEQALQEIKEQARTTMEKEKAVLQVQKVRDAEITRDAEIVKAEEDKQTQIVRAQGEKERTVIVAEGRLEEEKRNAQGIKAVGDAKAYAEKQLNMADVDPQIVLAQEIGENEGYQNYLLGIEQIKAAQEVGIEQAKALTDADVKVISNTGSATEGLTDVMELFTSQGGQKVGAMLEALHNTPQGEALLSKVTGSLKASGLTGNYTPPKSNGSADSGLAEGAADYISKTTKKKSNGSTGEAPTTKQ